MARLTSEQLNKIRTDISQYSLIYNDSSVYVNGSKWSQKKYGDCEIVGLLEKHRGYHVFLVKFSDGTLVKARHTNIKHGNVKNPYDYTSVCNVACLGRADSNDYLYEHWKQMINRCYNPKHNRYYCYGARGIKVCDRWRCFEYFIEDVKLLKNFEMLYQGYQLDRKDNNKNYSFENCRIVSPKDNARNRRSNVLIEIYKDDKYIETKLLTDVINSYHIDKRVIHKKAKDGSMFDGMRFKYAEI